MEYYFVLSKGKANYREKTKLQTASLQTFAQARMRKKLLEGEHALRDVMKPNLAR